MGRGGPANQLATFRRSRRVRQRCSSGAAGASRIAARLASVSLQFHRSRSGGWDASWEAACADPGFLLSILLAGCCALECATRVPVLFESNAPQKLLTDAASSTHVASSHLLLRVSLSLSCFFSNALRAEQRIPLAVAI